MTPHCRRCWLYWATATLASFSYLEARAYRRSCHPTLSRELRSVLGGRGCWLFAALGAGFAYHLSVLQDLADQQAGTTLEER